VNESEPTKKNSPFWREMQAPADGTWQNPPLRPIDMAVRCALVAAHRETRLLPFSSAPRPSSARFSLTSNLFALTILLPLSTDDCVAFELPGANRNDLFVLVSG
jgi:hypothetical protein